MLDRPFRIRASKWKTKKAQLSLEKADRTAYVRKPASDLQSQRKSDYPDVTTVSEMLR